MGILLITRVQITLKNGKKFFLGAEHGLKMQYNYGVVKLVIMK